MSEATTPVRETASPIHEAAVPVRAGAAGIVAFSVATTTTLGLVAGALHAAAGLPFLITFIYLRWSAVGLLLVTPTLRRLAPRWWTRLPAPACTGVTPVVLGIESVLVDIVVANVLHGS